MIYSFFMLLINYLDGERAILRLLYRRPRMAHLWPLNYILEPIDVGSRSTLLHLQQGVLQFVLLKPILAILILTMKFTDHYKEGYIAWSSWYLWLSLVYNTSVCIALYCLVMFYMQLSEDLKPYRPMPKFICVKSIIFATFWQGLLLAFLSFLGLIRDRTHIY